MEDVYETGTELFGDASITMLALMIFLAVAVLSFGMMAMIRTRGLIKRRASGIAEYSGEREAAESRSLRQSSLRAVQRILDYTTKHYTANQEGAAKVLRRRMIQAGIFDSSAVAFYFVARLLMGVLLSIATFVALPWLGLAEQSEPALWVVVLVGALCGYLAPTFYLDRRIAKNRYEHRIGFPDFMDLLVVCADSGLSMEAALERIGRELGDSHPSLCANLHMATLEIRAGRSMTEALEHLGDRLGLDEARSFATLIQQSTELGSSITDALRVYSDDMRHKRLSRAEEKAYSLPAKLSLPMMVCIFPVLFVVILLPVVVRLYTGHY
jgi:tight adherence protein C